MKSFLLFINLVICSHLVSFSQATTWAIQFSDAIRTRHTPTINNMTNKGWEYSNGIVLHGMEKVYNSTNDANYLNYIKAYVDLYVAANGTVSDLGLTVDKIQPGVLCLFLYEQTGQQKYLTAATNLKNYAYTNFRKTPDGGFWHKSEQNVTSYTYYNVMMADGMYMLHPFFAKYAHITNDLSLFDDLTFQLTFFANKAMYSPRNLPKHAWHYDKSKPWASPTTGESTDVWSRATGWYMMALADVLQYLPKTHARYNEILEIFQRMSAGVAATQDATTGLWYQVMDKPTASGNWLESSGSGMFVYALKKGVNYGWLSGATYNTVINKGWTGMKTMIANYSADNKPQIKQFCVATGVVNDAAAYIALAKANVPTPTGTQHPHGYCAILMASSAMEFSFSTLAPAISISSPAGGAAFTAPGPVSITATVTDNDGAIEKVEFFRGGTTKIGEATGYPYTISWTNVASGNYSITAKATDITGNTTTSAAISITVAPGAPNVFSKKISSGEDDVEEFADGTITRTSYALEMPYYSSVAGNQIIGLRFNNVTIPAGATITGAYIKFFANNQNYKTTNLTITGENSANSPAFTFAPQNVSGRSRTSSSVSWTPSAWTNAGALQQTPALTAVIQQIVNISGWASGNSLSLIISGSGKRTAFSFEGDAAKAAELVIEYQQ